MIGLDCSESIRRRESWEGYTDYHIIFFKENNCLLKRICNANTAAGKRGDLSRSPNDPLGFPYELVGFIQGVFCDCRPPRSSKCQPVRKFWHLELFWWDLLWNLTQLWEGRQSQKTPCKWSNRIPKWFGRVPKWSGWFPKWYGRLM